MSIDHQNFWTHSSFAFVGHTEEKGFPAISYREVKKQGKTVFPVDPSVSEIAGDRSYPDLSSLPVKVDAVLLEVPREETEDWVRQAADLGIQNVWIHENRETPEALAFAEERGMNVVTGTCAVMYVWQGGFSAHSVHRWIDKLVGKY